VTRTLIVTADDLGISESVNRAIRDAHRNGIVTSASLMANMPAFEHAVTSVLPETPELGVGAHLCLTSGRPCSPPAKVPLLVDDRGMFCHGFVGLWRLLLSKRRRDVLSQIEQELNTQFSRLLDAGIAMDHIDGHQHVHMLPGVRRLVARIARDHNLVMRISNERWSALPPKLSAITSGLPKAVVLRMCSQFDASPGPECSPPVNYVGVFESGRLDAFALNRILASLPPGVTELNTHPGYGPTDDDLLSCSATDGTFLTSGWREKELDALVDPQQRHAIQRHGVTLASFAQLISEVPCNR